MESEWVKEAMSMQEIEGKSMDMEIE